MAVNTLSPLVADTLKKFRDEMNQLIAERQFDGTKRTSDLSQYGRPEIATYDMSDAFQLPKDPRIIARKMSDTLQALAAPMEQLDQINTALDALVRPMHQMQELADRVNLLENVAMQLYVALEEALDSGTANTPQHTARPVTPQDLENWQNAAAAYREFIKR